MDTKKNKKKSVAWPSIIVLILLLPLLIPLLFCIGIIYLIVTILLYLAAWLTWNTRGIQLLYMYSNSPIWQEHIEKEILPKLPERKIVLNWSERKRWKKINLASFALLHFGGYREFNPIAVIFRPFCIVKVFRFYKPFKDYKHGKTDSLLKIEAEFFQALKV